MATSKQQVIRQKPYWLLAIIWFLASIYALLLAPTSQEPPPFIHFDKIIHAALFFGQTWLVCKIFLQVNKPIPYKTIAIMMFTWAIGSEILQATLTTNRSGDVLDVLADIVGVFLAMVLARKVSIAKNNYLNDKD